MEAYRARLGGDSAGRAVFSSVHVIAILLCYKLCFWAASSLSALDKCDRRHVFR